MFDSDQISDLFSGLKALVKHKCITLEIISIVLGKWQAAREDAQSPVLLAMKLNKRREHFSGMWS